MLASHKNFPGMIVHLLILIAGIACLYLANLQYQKTRLLMSAAVITTATVIELLEETDDDSRLFRPRFQFMDQQHQPVEFNGLSASYPAAWRKGETVRIVYNPKITADVKIMTYWSLFRATILLVALASPLLVIGMGYFVFQFTIHDAA